MDKITELNRLAKKMQKLNLKVIREGERKAGRLARFALDAIQKRDREDAV